MNRPMKLRQLLPLAGLGLWALGAGVVFAGDAASPVFRSLIAATLRQGPDGQLPPHLSVVLGISRIEQSIAVKQAVLRGAHEVHVFNVSKANHDDVVLLIYSDQSESTRAYLISKNGKLRKAVFFQGSEPALLQSAAESKDDFATELKFWKNFSSQLPTH